MAVPDSAAFVCYDCKLEFVPAKVFRPMRIFLSYGHDANEELVRRIKTDLEQRGHDVWFDQTDIKAGDDWRRAITDGILHSQRFLCDSSNARSFAGSILTALATCIMMPA